MEKVLEQIKGKLIVSCQALEYEPLYGSNLMARMALAAFQGGAAGVRANTYDDIVAIKATVNLPVIGIVKRDYKDSDIYITPTIKEIREVAAAGAEIVALDCTLRKRPDGENLEDLIKSIRKEFPELLIMADISTLEEGINADRLGVNLISTTLSGYTEYTLSKEGPDMELIKELVLRVSTPVIAEGKIDTPEQARLCLEAGAHAIVVGGAITRPKQITERFIKAINF